MSKVTIILSNASTYGLISFSETSLKLYNIFCAIVTDAVCEIEILRQDKSEAFEQHSDSRNVRGKRQARDEVNAAGDATNIMLNKKLLEITDFVFNTLQATQNELITVFAFPSLMAAVDDTKQRIIDIENLFIDVKEQKRFHRQIYKEAREEFLQRNTKCVSTQNNLDHEIADIEALIQLKLQIFQDSKDSIHYDHKLKLKHLEQYYKNMHRNMHNAIHDEYVVNESITEYNDRATEDVLNKIKFWENKYDEDREMYRQKIYRLEGKEEQLRNKLFVTYIMYAERQKDMTYYLDHKQQMAVLEEKTAAFEEKRRESALQKEVLAAFQTKYKPEETEPKTAKRRKTNGKKKI